MKHYFILLIGFLLYSKGWAQTYPHINLTIKDGLPSNTVYSIFPDSKGYLWFCTDKGLAVYNGKNFRSFSTASGLPDNEIFSVIEDHQGRLWLATFNGELCFYKDGVFHTEANTPWLKLSFKVHINGVQIERDGSITFAFIGFKYIVNILGDHLSTYDINKLASQVTLHGNSLIGIEKKSPNVYQLTTTDRSLQIDTFGNLLAPPKKLSRLYWSCTFNKQLTFINFDGLYNYDEQLIFPFKKHTSLYEHMICFSNGRDIWIGRHNGLFINDSLPIINNQFVTSVRKDREGNYWIGTREQGAYFMNKNMEHFKEWKNAYKGVVKQSVSLRHAVNFITNTGNIYQLDNTALKHLYSMKDTQLEGDAKKYSFCGNSNGDYLIFSGQNHYALNRNLNDSYTCRDISQPLKKLGALVVKQLFQHRGNLYILQISTLWRANFAALQQGQLTDTETVINAPFDQRIYACAENKADQTIWISKSNGLYHVSDGQTILQQQLKHTSFRQMQFFGNYLLGYTDKNHFLICNNYNGKVVIDTLRADNCIYENIHQIDDTRAIISTNNYYRLLQLYPPSQNGKPNYSVKIIDDPFVPLQTEYIHVDSSYCYFFKEGTITRVAISALFAPIQPPSPLFSTLKVGAKIYAIQQKIVIPYSEADNINITFDEISFLGKGITSQYSISANSTDKWVDITGNEINLNSPGYGTFTIKVRSKTLSSAYSRPAVLVLKIERPFWATWWFVTLCILALLGIIWGIILLITWRKLRKKQKEHEADMKFQQSEYKALNALMNPHFIFNSLNNIQGLINKDEKRTANEYLVIFSDLVRQNMHNISKGFISLQEELTLIENYLTLEKLRFKELVNYNIKIEEDVDVDDIMIPPLMIQPLVENAVKHGLLPMQSASARVSIEVYEREDMLYIIIEDNGIGLTASLKSQNKLHESFGLSNLQKRTDHLKKIQQQEFNIEITEMKDADGKVLGTKAAVTIQL